MERAAALRAGISFLGVPQVGPGGGAPVAAGLDAEQMPAVPVGAGDVLALAQHLVGDDLAVVADRPEGAAVRAGPIP